MPNQNSQSRTPFTLAAAVALFLSSVTELRAAPPLVKKPHPIITEILYAVPKGDDGDASQDGRRSATGDEFIELINPHDTSINLKGYAIVDGRPLKGPDAKPAIEPKGTGRGGKSTTPRGKGTPNPSDEPGGDSTPATKKPKSRVIFTFPDLTLKPGEIVVVFNGFETTPKGSADQIGTSTKAPSRNPNFHDAYVFTMQTKSSYAALANTGDCVSLIAPDATAIECVHWGDTSDKDDEGTNTTSTLDEKAPSSDEVKGSIQRTTLHQGSAFKSHDSLNLAARGTRFSPGVFEESTDPAPPADPSDDTKSGS
ncbi:MAG: lamin tail domain-containing protein [Phycisphaerales bacterium]|nr:MAG: lamin tail domain-containing protein [Phycisphaerales bacterium]